MEPVGGQAGVLQAGHVGHDAVPALPPLDRAGERTEGAAQPRDHHAQPRDPRGAVLVLPQVGRQLLVRHADAASQREPHEQPPLERPANGQDGSTRADHDRPEHLHAQTVRHAAQDRTRPRPVKRPVHIG
jgi:hypothetical protein